MFRYSCGGARAFEFDDVVFGEDEEKADAVSGGDDEMDACVNGIGANKDAMVKVKDEEELDADDDTACHLDSILDMNSEAFNWNIAESESPAQAQEDEVSKVGTNKKDIFLRLNYEEVITAWASQGSPWTTGTPPKFFNSDDCWLDLVTSLQPSLLMQQYLLVCLV